MLLLGHSYVPHTVTLGLEIAAGSGEWGAGVGSQLGFVFIQNDTCRHACGLSTEAGVGGSEASLGMKTLQG